jgi:uridylate kinase
MAKTFVLSVGGSLIVTAGGIDVDFLRKFRSLILRQTRAGNKFYLVIGGGATARQYIKAAQEVIGLKPGSRDWLGISATRLNAQLIKTIFSSATPDEIITDPTRKIKTAKKIVIAAGYRPGWSTDYVAVLIAKHNNIKTVINLSNIDYAYDKDPRKFTGARKLKQAAWPEFQRIVGTKWHPGLNAPFDPIASREAAKNGLKVIIVNGRKIKNLAACLAGGKFQGTVIH